MPKLLPILSLLLALIGEPRAVWAEDASETNSLELTEVLYTAQYLQVGFIDPIPNEALQWEKNSARFLYIPKSREPFLYFMGTLSPGYELSIGNEWVKAGVGRRFQVRLPTPLEPSVIEFKVFAPDRTFRIHRISTIWLKLPPSVRARIKEGADVYEKSAGFVLDIKRMGFAQLYSMNTPTAAVDLDSTRHAHLNFRLYVPPEEEPSYDSWKLTLRDENGRIVTDIKRYGNPPPYLPWYELGNTVLTPGRYSYELTLTEAEEDLRGALNYFDTVEGLSLLTHSYLPAISIEPKAEMGYFNISDATGFQTGNAYLGAELTMALRDRFIFKGMGLMSLHTLDTTSFFTLTRGATGFRFSSAGTNSPILGSPYFFRIDGMVTLTGITMHDAAPIVRYAHIGLLLDGLAALDGVHLVLPSAELTVKPDLDQIRLSVGLGYGFFVRPWSMRVGMGINYDTLLKSSTTPRAKFELLRAYTSFSFFL